MEFSVLVSFNSFKITLKQPPLVSGPPTDSTSSAHELLEGEVGQEAHSGTGGVAAAVSGLAFSPRVGS